MNKITLQERIDIFQNNKNEYLKQLEQVKKELAKVTVVNDHEQFIKYYNLEKELIYKIGFMEVELLKLKAL